MKIKVFIEEKCKRLSRKKLYDNLYDNFCSKFNVRVCQKKNRDENIDKAGYWLNTYLIGRGTN